MRKLIALTAAALVAATVLITIPADSQPSVDFDRQRSWIVIVDTDVISGHPTRTEAEAAATLAKLDQPNAFVAYSPQVHYLATINNALAPPPTATTAPTAAPTVAPTATPEPPPTATTAPTVAPTATPEPEPTATTATTAPPTTTPEPSEPEPVGLVWGYDETRPAADWTRPDLYVPYTDPAYGTTITRVTSADGTRFNRNTYSRRQAENADGTAFMTYHGTAAYYIYERATGAQLAELPASPDSEPQWHPTNPNLVRFIAQPNSYTGELQLFEADIRTGQIEVIADLGDRLQQLLPGSLYLKDRAEGSPSADGNRYAWLVYDDQEDNIGVITYDLATDEILGILPTDDLADAGFLDALSMSPTGRYVVTQQSNGTYVYDADLTNRRLLFAGGEHSDIALDANGNDAYVYIDFTPSANAGWLMSVNLETLAETRIFDIYDDTNTSIHISGKGYNKPGWVIASTYNCKVDFGWACTKVMAVELRPNGRILNLAHTYNCGDSYWTETHAVVNRDFTRVYFNSDSGSCGIDAEVLLIDLPNFS